MSRSRGAGHLKYVADALPRVAAEIIGAVRERGTYGNHFVIGAGSAVEGLVEGLGGERGGGRGGIRLRLSHVRHAVAELEAAAAEIRASGPWRAQCVPLEILDGERRSEESDAAGRGAHG